MTQIQEQINYIKNCMKERKTSDGKIIPKTDNIGIYTGKLSEKQKKEFSKHFKIEAGLLGYTHFYKKESTRC